MRKLTPTEDLILDSLAARTRLGEPFWHFDLHFGKAIGGLRELGLVTYEEKDGLYRLRITEMGRARALDLAYMSPLERQLYKVSGQLAHLREIYR